MQTDAQTKKLLKSKVQPMLEKLIVEIIMNKPENITKFMI